MKKSILIGRITKDPELVAVNGGKEKVSFTVASERSYGKDESGNRICDFWYCTAWGKTAAFIAQYFKKGKTIVILGEDIIRSFTDSEGNRKTVCEVDVSEVSFSLSDPGTVAASLPRNTAIETPDTAASNDNLPF